MSYINSRGFYYLCPLRNTKPQSSSESLDIDRYLREHKEQIVYVCNTAIRSFFYNVVPYMTKPFVLVSGDADHAMPYDILSYSEFQTFVQSPLLCHWFCQNLMLTHPKMTHLPIGLDYHTLEGHINSRHPWGIGATALEQEEVLKRIAASAAPLEERKLLCYSNFHHTTFGINLRGDRQEAIAKLPKGLVFYDDVYRSREDTWSIQSQYAFVLSPRGGGYDCHRTWEALLLGSIPIVKSSGLDPVYEGLPVLIVDDWSDITEDLLRRTVEEFGSRSYALEKLELTYWRYQIYRKIERGIRIREG